MKGFAEHVLVGSGVARRGRRRMARRVLVVAYHNVVPDGTEPGGDLPNHLPLSTFIEQIGVLAATHDIVPLAEALHPPRPATRRPRAVITFDDAYRGAVLHAVPELVRRRIPAAIFVAPGLLGGAGFWWDALARPGGGGLDGAMRDAALDTHAGDGEAVLAAAAASGRAPAALSSVLRAASTDEVLHAASLPGITLGSHSWSHPNLTRLDRPRLADELAKPIAWLNAHLRDPLPWIAYPYGLHDARVRRAAAEAGYEAALAIDGGWIAETPADRYALPRVNVSPGLSIRGFMLRGAGMLAG